MRQELSRRRLLTTLTATAGCLAVPAVRAAETLQATEDTPFSPCAPQGPLDSERFRSALRQGDLEAVRIFLQRDPALAWSRDDEGRSAFVLAYLAGRPEIATLLRERGVQLDLADAAMVPDWDRIASLGEIAPGLVNADHPVGGTALWAAARFGAGSQIFRLYSLGADLDANPRGEEGTTPVRAVFDCTDPVRRAETAASLLGNGGSVNTAQKGAGSVLHGAAAAGDPHLVRLVLRKGGDASARDAVGKTPLDIALDSGHGEAAEILRHPERIALDLLPSDPRSSRHARDASGGEVELADIEHYPRPLVNRLVGASHTQLETVREILDRHPQLLSALADWDEMTIEACAHTGFTEIVDFYLDRGAPLSLPTCLTLGKLDRAGALLAEEPLRIRERGPHDFPLTWYPTIAGGKVEVAAWLVEHGIDVDSEAMGVTGLHRAASRDQSALVEFWIAAGAEVNARTVVDGKTPLDLAIESDQPTSAGLLRRAGGATSDRSR